MDNPAVAHPPVPEPLDERDAGLESRVRIKTDLREKLSVEERAFLDRIDARNALGSPEWRQP